MKTKIVLLLCLVASAVSADVVMIGEPMKANDPTNPLSPIADAIGSAWMTKILLWMGACRAVGKLVSTRVQDMLEAARKWAKGDKEAGSFMDRLLHNPIYRGASFLVDYFFSIKFPQLEQVAAAAVMQPETAKPTGSIDPHAFALQAKEPVAELPAQPATGRGEK